ncbi:uncharacterized protein BDW43DRAFT_274703 [Aspergillus alliaceus]|uniref:uncharacterized protein n=1 Tax=Petromyces alliaceus TaxID=209559 RepID=UPI0012A629F0|nr:uncharacterized protein BDW43DRAFT_274703 [Aspergillus alliaceus]KAB8233961.1 hypothetical protein BDW43DRAFT_274703 [Aspergillus alliaceus]
MIAGLKISEEPTRNITARSTGFDIYLRQPPGSRWRVIHSPTNRLDIFSPPISTRYTKY